MKSESWQKSTKDISDSDLNITSLLKCWFDKQEVAGSVTTGTSILFLFFVFINNDGPQVHWMSKFQFKFLNHILWLLILWLSLLLILLLLFLMKNCNGKWAV